MSFFSGFKEQIYDVYRYLPPATQVVLISATLPHEILEMTNKFMTDPIRILVKRLVYRPPENTERTYPEIVSKQKHDSVNTKSLSTVSVCPPLPPSVTS